MVCSLRQLHVPNCCRLRPGCSSGDMGPVTSIGLATAAVDTTTATAITTSTARAISQRLIGDHHRKRTARQQRRRLGRPCRRSGPVTRCEVCLLALDEQAVVFNSKYYVSCVVQSFKLGRGTAWPGVGLSAPTSKVIFRFLGRTVHLPRKFCCLIQLHTSRIGVAKCTRSHLH